MKHWKDDDELFSIARKKLFSALVGDSLDKMGLLHQFLPQGVKPLAPGMTVIGRAMPVLEADVFAERGDGAANALMSKPFGLMFEALDSLKPGEVYICQPSEHGLWFMDVVPDGEAKWGFPNLSDTAEIVELASCGAQIVLYTTGRGSVAGCALVPVIKVCANPETYARMSDDMDINAGAVVSEGRSLDDVAGELYEKTLAVAAGELSRPEALGHREFFLGYKRFECKKENICIGIADPFQSR